MKSLVNQFLKFFGLEIHGTNYIQKLRNNEFEKNYYQEIQFTLKNASTIFDIGSNRGEFALNMSLIFPNATIQAFEPFPPVFEQLVSNIKNNKNIFANQLAISDKRCQLPFHVNKSVDTNSLLKSIKTNQSFDKATENVEIINVESTTLDIYCSENKIDKIDILKMDIQGAELLALKGAKNLLLENKIKAIFLEISFQPQYSNQALFIEIYNVLNENGFVLSNIFNPYYANNSLAWADGLFLHKSQY